MRTSDIVFFVVVPVGFFLVVALVAMLLVERLQGTHNHRRGPLRYLAWATVCSAALLVLYCIVSFMAQAGRGGM